MMYAAGLRSDALFAAAVLALLPLYFIVVLLNLRLFPPETAISGDFRAILHPGDAVDPTLPPETKVLGARSFDDDAKVKQASAQNDTPIFTSQNESRTLEGIVLWVAAVALILSMAYFALEPLIYRIWPEDNASKQGPASFPVSIHIGVDDLRIVNGSTEQWNCLVVLGRPPLYQASIMIGAQNATGQRYDQFQTLRAGEADAQDDTDQRRAAARHEVGIDCSDLKGGRHFWSFR